MSTADSILIAISQLVTTEIAYPMKPDANPHQVSVNIEGLLSFITRILTHLSYLSLDQCYWQDLLIPYDDTRFALDAFMERGVECHLQYHLCHLSTGYPVCVHRTVCSSEVSSSRDPSVGIGYWKVRVCIVLSCTYVCSM